MFDALYQEDADRALKLEAQRPRAEPKPQPGFFSGIGGALWRGPTQGAVESARFGVNLLEAYGKTVAFVEGAPKEQSVDRILEQSDSSRELGKVAKSFEVDPATTGTAGQIVHGFTKFGAKGIGYLMTTGPMGPLLFGIDEGTNEGLRLADRGVDTQTALKVGAVHGATSAVSLALPLAGRTAAQTAALVVGGGPVAFMGEQGASRTILELAGYDEISREYDPFDITGLLVSTLGPAAFGVGAHAARGMRARKAAGRTEPAAEQVPQEAIDAARVQVLAEQDAGASLFEPLDAAGQARHADAMREAERAIGEARTPKINEVVPRERAPELQRLPETARAPLLRMYEQAEAAKPQFDATVREIALAVGGTAKLADLKGMDRATAKVVSDYGGDPTKIKDLLRATVEVESATDAQRAVASILERFEVLPTGRRNLLDPSVEPVDGYRDAKFNVVVDGHVAEVQINLPAMLRAKKKAHRFYAERTAIEREIGDGAATPEQLTRIDALNARMREIYEPAWAEATSSRKAASEIGAPLRRADSAGKDLGGSESNAALYGSPGARNATGMPSTSKNSALGGKESGSLIASTSERILPLGRAARVVTERGATVETRFAVVEAETLVTSHDNALRPNPEFPPELQPRDRSRAASELQIARIENAINPELLGDSPKASDGAPIVGRDSVVESGNARTIALRRAYESGKAEGYRTWLESRAADFGLDPAAIAGMRRPMLVRVGEGDYNRVEFVRQANESSVAAMSPVEQAMLDSARLPDLGLLSAREDGTINIAESRQFIRQFMETVSPSERAALVTADGALSQAGLARIRNAIFSKAYGDAHLVSMMAESTDTNVKNVMAGMLRAAPAVARLRELVEAGARQPIDVAPDLVQAVRTFSKLREDGMTVERFLAQGSLVDDGVSPEVATLLRAVAENARAPRRIADLIGSMVETVDTLGDPRQQGMFGDAPATQADVVDRAIGAVRDNVAEQVLEARPDLIMQMDDGTTVSAREALEAARTEVEQAKVDARAFDAAVNCFLARG